MSDLDYGLFDCDTHCYEPRDAFTRYLPKEFRDRAVTPVRMSDGSEAILAGRRIASFNSEQGLGWDMAYRPGSLKEMLRQMASGNPDETYQPEPIRPEYVEREPRLRLLQEQNVEKCVLYPAGMALAAEHYVKDTAALYANVHSFNRWYDETWGFNYQDTLYATALMSLRDLDMAVKEVEHVLDRGARVVLFPTGPAYGRSPGDPYFDPIWARLNEAHAVIALHIMPYWYFDAISPAWGYDPDPGSWHMSAWQWNNVYGERPIEDTLSALIFDNLFGRFPNLMVLVSEHGAEWAPHFVRHMDKSRGMGRNGPWIGGSLEHRPSQVFRQHVRVAPYPEDNIPWVVENLGQHDSIVMGSDFPHAEGIAHPADYKKLLDPLPEDIQRRILRDNADRLFAGS
jgi:predicted TIM-barrel fold metal-dependent hydrolase